MAQPWESDPVVGGSLRDRLLADVEVATPERSERYFSDDDFRWAETLQGDDSPSGRPTILINDPKFQAEGATNYRNKMVLAESLHLLKRVDPDRHNRLRSAALDDPQYMQWARESYEHAKQQGEQRPFEQWHDVSRLDQVIGGYLFAGDQSIPTMANWNRERLPYGTEFRQELEALRSELMPPKTEVAANEPWASDPIAEGPWADDPIAKSWLQRIGEKLTGAVKAMPVQPINPRIVGNTAESIGAMTSEMVAGSGQMIQESRARTAEQQLAGPEAGTIAAYRAMQGLPPEDPGALRESAERFGGVAEQARIGGQEAIPEDASRVERAVQQGVASAAVSLPAVFSLGPAGAAGLLGLGSAGARYSELRAQGVEPAVAQKSANMIGALEGLTEFLPGRALVKKQPDFWKRVTEFLATEIPGENINTVAQIVDDYRLQLRDDVTKEAVLSAMLDTTLATIAGGGAQVGVAQVMQKAVEKANRAEQPAAPVEAAPPADELGEQIAEAGYQDAAQAPWEADPIVEAEAEYASDYQPPKEAPIPPPPTPPAEPQQERRSREFNPQQDSLLEAVAKLGGLNREEAEAQGIDPDHFKDRGYGIKRIFTKGGDTLDGMRERLEESGYDFGGDVNGLLNALQDNLMGTATTYGAGGIGRQADRAAHERDFDQYQRDRATYDAIYSGDPELFVPEKPDSAYDPEADRQARTIKDLYDRAAAVDENAADGILEKSEHDSDAAIALWEIINGRRLSQETPQAGLGQPREVEAAPRRGAQDGRKREADERRPATSETRDIFGEDTRTAQEVADETRRRDARRNTGQESVETGDPSDLFSQARRQRDIEDAAESIEVAETDPGDLTPEQRAVFDRARESRAEAELDTQLERQAATEGRQQASERGMDTAVNDLLAGAANAPTVEFVNGIGGVPANLRKRVRRSKGTRTEGLYDPKTNRVFILTDTVKTPERAAWVAAHEIAGHRGLHGLFNTREGKAALDRALTRARQNRTVRNLADTIREQRTALNETRATEEAVAELSAAVRTGDYGEIETRYGVTVPQAVRGGVKAAILRFLHRIRSALIRLAGGRDFSDADVRSLIEDSWRYVREGEAREASGTAQGQAARASEAAAPAATRPKAKKQPGDRGYAKLAQRAIDWFNDRVGWRYGVLGKLPAQKIYLQKRYLALGKVREAHEIGRSVFKALSKANAADTVAVYDYMTTQGAKPALIENAAVRDAAVRAKSLIDQVGRRLVDAGLLTPEAYRDHAGSYLPRLYLKHLLGEKNLGAIGKGKKLSDMGYLKKRKDIPKEVREVILGEITDPAFLASFGLNRTMRDLALLDFLKAVAANRQWVPENSVVEWRGRTVSPYWLRSEARALRDRAALYQPEPAAKARKIADQMDALAREAIADLAIDLESFQQIPDTSRYGALRGMWVRKEIYDDIVGAQQFIPEGASWVERVIGQGGTLTKVTQWWKLSKVALNPPTQIRNFLSNMILVHLSGVPMHRVYTGEILTKAIKSIITKDKYFRIATKYGLFATTFSSQELRRIEDSWIALQKQKGGGIARLKAMGATITNFASDAYSMMEAVGKIAKLRDAMEREGKSEADAMIEAHEALFDYSLVPRWVQYTRNSPLGIPFLTFQYKVLPQLAKTAIKHPLRFAPYAALAALPAALIEALYDVDDDDVEKLRNTFPEWMREKGHMLLLPWKDSAGKWQVLDFGYIVPWGMFSDVAASMTGGDPRQAMKEVGFLSGPVNNVIAALATNVDPFTNKEIVERFATPKERLLQMLNYIWSLSAPGLLTEYGGVNRLRGAIEGDVDPRSMEPPMTASQAAMRMFGINTYPVDPEASLARNLSFMQWELSELRRKMNERLSDPNLTDKGRERVVRAYTTLIENQVKRIEDYAKSVEIHPNLSRGQTP